MALSLVRRALTKTAFPLIKRAVLPSVFPDGRKPIFASPRRFISTTENKKDSVTTINDNKIVNKQEPVEDLEEKEENWISYGYNFVDRDLDEYTYHLNFFMAITVCICGGAFFIAYCPNARDQHWFVREAFLLIEQRKNEGLPLIDKNLVDPSKFELPSDEELGDFDIIV